MKWINDAQGNLVNLGNVNRLRVMNNSVLAELSTSTIVIAKCDSPEDAVAKVRKIADLDERKTDTTTAVPEGSETIVETPKKRTTRRKKK